MIVSEGVLHERYLELMQPNGEVIDWRLALESLGVDYNAAWAMSVMFLQTEVASMLARNPEMSQEELLLTVAANVAVQSIMLGVHIGRTTDGPEEDEVLLDVEGIEPAHIDAAIDAGLEELLGGAA